MQPRSPVNHGGHDQAAAAPGNGARESAAAAAAKRKKKTRRLIGRGSGAAVAMRVAPSWDLVHTNFMRVLDAEQRALLLGKPMIKPNGVSTVRWDLKLERRDFINSLLAAFGVASKKKLLCGAGLFIAFRPFLDCVSTDLGTFRRRWHGCQVYV